MSAKVKEGWPVAKSTRNLIPILVAILKPCATFENELPGLLIKLEIVDYLGFLYRIP